MEGRCPHLSCSVLWSSIGHVQRLLQSLGCPKAFARIQITDCRLMGGKVAVLNDIGMVLTAAARWSSLIPSGTPIIRVFMNILGHLAAVHGIRRGTWPLQQRLSTSDMPKHSGERSIWTDTAVIRRGNRDRTMTGISQRVCDRGWPVDWMPMWCSY